MNKKDIKRAFTAYNFFYLKEEGLLSDARIIVNLNAFEKKEQILLKTLILQKTGDLESYGDINALNKLKDLFYKNEKEIIIRTHNTNLIYKKQFVLFSNEISDIAVHVNYAGLIDRHDYIYGRTEVDPLVIKNNKGITKLVINPVRYHITNLGIGKLFKGLA